MICERYNEWWTLSFKFKRNLGSELSFCSPPTFPLLLAMFPLFKLLAVDIDFSTSFLFIEYLGCFAEDTEKRVFSHAAGDYQPDEISPVQCMVTCGRRYNYAAIQNGKLCMCSNELPTTRTSQASCSAACPGTVNYPPGETKPSCGGLNTISVYSIKNRILGLKILDPGPVKIFEKMSFGANIINGLESIFTFDFGDGDGTKPLFSSTPNITHIYDRPGKYEMILKAYNNISGTQEARRLQPVIDDIDEVVITCPTATVVGRPIECNGTVSRGIDTQTKIDFGDGDNERIIISKFF